MSNITIIGAGLTGLCLSIILKKKGYDVTVVEKNTFPGGVFASSIKKKYLFHSGLEFYFPHIWLTNFFKEIDENINDYIEFDTITNKFNVFLGETKPLEPYDKMNFNNDYQDFVKKIIYLEGDINNLNNLFETINKIKDEFNSFFIEKHDPAQLERFLLRNKITGSLKDLLSQYFRNSNTLAFFDAFGLFYGDSSNYLPAYYIFILVDMLQNPMYRPQKGFADIAEKLYLIGLKSGVKYWFGQEVESVKIEDSKIKSIRIKDNESLLLQVELNKENKFEIPYQENILSCEILIHTGDYENFEENILINQEHRTYDQKFWKKVDSTPSYCTFLIGLKDEIPQLQKHCFITGHDPKGNQLNMDSSLYFVSTSSKDNVLPTLKIISYQPCGVILKENDNDKLLLNCINRINKLLKIDLNTNIVSYTTLDPEDLKDQFLYSKKSPFGIRHNLKNPTKFLAEDNKKITNLFYATNSNYPAGNGLLSIIRAKSLASSSRFPKIEKKIESII